MKIKKFVEENQEALLSLADKLVVLRDCTTIKDERELLGRQYAIEIMDGWLKEIFNIETSDLFPVVEDEGLDIVNYRDKVERGK